MYLSTNQLGPAYDGLELGIGESIILKAIGESCGKVGTFFSSISFCFTLLRQTLAALKAAYKDLGDLGTLAMESRQTQKMLFAQQALSLQNVFKSFRSIATISGSKSANEKRNMIKKLLVSAKNNETRYIVRSLQGKLRIGLAAKVLNVLLRFLLKLTGKLNSLCWSRWCTRSC